MAQSNAFMQWMADNPEARNMATGFLKSLEDRKSSDAMAGSEIAKTQYGYLTGAGTGRLAAQPKSSLDRALQGYISGAAERQDNELNKAIIDKLSDKKGRVPASIKPGDEVISENLYEAKINANPSHPISIERPLSDQVQAAMNTKEVLSAGAEIPFRNASDSAVPSVFESPNALFNLERNPLTDAQKNENSRLQREKEAAIFKDFASTPFGNFNRKL